MSNCPIYSSPGPSRDARYKNLVVDKGVFRQLTVCDLRQPSSSKDCFCNVAVVKSLPSGSNTIGDVTVSQWTAGDTPVADAFGRIRTADPYTIFDSKYVFSDDTVQWDEVSTGTGASTYRSDLSSMESTITAGTTGSVTRQTYQHVIYQPGKSQLIYMTGVLGTPVTNATKRIGNFDDTNGIFLQQEDGVVSWVLRSSTSGSPVDEVVDQSEWNIDTLDGTGPSGEVFVPENSFLMIIDFAWLGTGRVRCGFVYAGQIVYAHEFLSTDLQVPYMSTPVNPLRTEISATSAVPEEASLIQTCAAVMIEGNYNPIGNTFMIDTGSTTASVTGETPVMAIRLKDGFGSATLFIDHLHVINTANNNCLFRVYLRPTLANVTAGWTDADALSGVEYTIYDGATNAFTFSGGMQIDSFYVSRDLRAETSLQPNYAQSLSHGIAGGPGHVALVTAEGVNAATSEVAVSIAWVEYV